MKETPQYADISDAELRDIEAEFGHPLTERTRTVVCPECSPNKTAQDWETKLGTKEEMCLTSQPHSGHTLPDNLLRIIELFLPAFLKETLA